MWKKIAILCLLAASTVGCATDATVRTSAYALPGSYYSGDGLGRNVTLELGRDRHYQVFWEGCLGLYGQSAGTWSLEGETLLFRPEFQNEGLDGYLTKATTISYDGKLGFVREQDLQRDQVGRQMVFLRQSSP